MIKAISGTVLTIVILGGLAWASAYHDLLFTKFFAPRQEAIRYEVFKETQSFNEGMIMELQSMRFQYVKANDAQKLALRGIILHRASAYPADKLPADLYTFIEELKQ